MHFSVFVGNSLFNITVYIMPYWLPQILPRRKPLSTSVSIRSTSNSTTRVIMADCILIRVTPLLVRPLVTVVIPRPEPARLKHTRATRSRRARPDTTTGPPIDHSVLSTTLRFDNKSYSINIFNSPDYPINLTRPILRIQHNVWPKNYTNHTS